LKHLYFTVTNDLVFDQRMHRICTSLSDAGYKVTLVGRTLKTSSSLEQKRFAQKRLRCFFHSGFLFYVEYNMKLFFFLLFHKMEGICAIDLDTIIPCLLVSKIRRIPGIYDAHEYFTEMKEVRERALIKKIWTFIERFALTRFQYCYTVSNGLAIEFAKKYGKSFEVIRNVPYLKTLLPQRQVEGYLFYAGAVNEARGFEYLIPAMKTVQHKLVICGDGNFMSKLKDLIRKHQVEDKIELKGMKKPEEIYEMAQKALLGFNLVEKDGLNQYYSLANKFFDYIQAGLPQITMNFPEYSLVNKEFEVAVLINDLSIETLSDAIQKTLSNAYLLEQLHRNTLKARQVYNWETEEKKLLQIYDKVCKDSGLINGE
jgi:glycosyltransferase involved in cell wall biosynthesis